jgi:lysophospholipase L1-like esterase
MTSAREGRLSVAVFGASVTALVCGPRREGSQHLTFPAVLAREEADGIGFDVETHSWIYGLISRCSGIWLQPLAQTRPDVVVLQFGLGETFPRIVPKALIYHLLGVARHSSRWRDAYWRRARRILLAIHRVECLIDRFLPVSWCRMSPKRFRAELDMVCTKIQDQIGSRIVLMTAYPATAPTPFLTDKMHRRLVQVNAAILDVAAARGATVFPLDDVVSAAGADALPDGLHMSVDAHRAVGEHLARCLVTTAARQVA